MSCARTSCSSYTTVSQSTYGVYPAGPVLPAGSLAGNDQALAISTTGYFYILDFTKKDVAIVAPDGTTIAAYNPGLVTPLGVCESPVDNSVWITDLSASDEHLWGINTQTGQVINSIPVAGYLNSEANNCNLDAYGFIYVCAANGHVFKYALNQTTAAPYFTFTHPNITWCMDLIIDPPTGNLWQTSYYQVSFPKGIIRTTQLHTYITNDVLEKSSRENS